MSSYAVNMIPGWNEAMKSTWVNWHVLPLNALALAGCSAFQLLRDTAQPPAHGHQHCCIRMEHISIDGQPAIIISRKGVNKHRSGYGAYMLNKHSYLQSKKVLLRCELVNSWLSVLLVSQARVCSRRLYVLRRPLYEQAWLLEQHQCHCHLL